MYVVCVTFTIKSGEMPRFLPLMQENAATSVSDEPDCHQFDVCQSETNPDEIFLYELYTDRPGFDAHLATDHFRRFDAAVADMIADKAVKTYVRL